MFGTSLRVLDLKGSHKCTLHDCWVSKGKSTTKYSYRCRYRLSRIGFNQSECLWLSIVLYVSTERCPAVSHGVVLNQYKRIIF